MKDALLRLSVMLQVLREDRGQDLVEYALVIAVLALGTSASMGALATSINSALGRVHTTISGYL